MKKIKIITSILSLSLLILALPSCGSGKTIRAGKNDTHLALENGKTVVERYGQLQVQNGTLCNEAGEPVQLRGMSSHGLQWYGKYANEKVITWLRDDWNAQLWRAAMYISEGGYLSGKAIKLKVNDSVEACIKNGMYVLVDWHVLNDHDPLLHVEEAKEYFAEMAQKYGHLPNVIWEICNEPNSDKVTWEGNIKPYAEQVIATIRQYDPDNIIVVGTPGWSSRADLVIGNELQGDNIMYAHHFYAGSHTAEHWKTLDKCLEAGLPIFITEWGTTQSTGDGGVYETETLQWMRYLNDNNLSWANWSVNNKGEDSGVLKMNKDKAAVGGWTESDLSVSGILMRKILRNEVKLPKLPKY